MDYKLYKKFNIIFEIVIFLCIGIVAFSVTPITFQNDTFYTIKIGEHIQNVGIDMEDPFSWHENLEYTYPHWLYDTIIYNVYSLLGFFGIYLLTFILAWILGITIYYVEKNISQNNIISFFTTILTLVFLMNFITARAQLVTFILFVLTIYFIEKFLKNKKVLYFIALFIISVLIANLHCAVWPFFFILFLPYIGEYILSFILNKKNTYSKIIVERNKNIPLLFIIMIVCIFSGLLTPIGTTPYTYLYKTLIGNTTSHIYEHLPIVLINSPFTLIFLVIILILLINPKSKINLSHLLLFLGLTLLTLLSGRQSSLLILLGSIISCKIIVDLLSATISDLKENCNKIVNKFSTYCIIIYFSLCLCSFGLNDKVKNYTFVDTTIYPVAACDYICENIDLENARFFNEYDYGSYMLFRGIPVFIDSRADLYSPEFNGENVNIFSDFTDLNIGKVYYEDIFKKYNITHVILKKDSLINVDIQGSHDENYKELYSDDYFIVYERLNTI